MAAYLKTDMPFYGVPAPQRRVILRALKAQYPVATDDAYRSEVESLWVQPHREEKYLALDWASSHKRFVSAVNLDLYERLIVEGSWWDLVDDAATHLVGPVFRSDPEATLPWLVRWIQTDQMWLRRSAIICQVGSKDKTDTETLFGFIRTCMEEREFFITKAIGWSLRELSKRNPEAVVGFLAEHTDQMARLSVREASKYI